MHVVAFPDVFKPCRRGVVIRKDFPLIVQVNIGRPKLVGLSLWFTFSIETNKHHATSFASSASIHWYKWFAAACALADAANRLAGLSFNIFTQDLRYAA